MITMLSLLLSCCWMHEDEGEGEGEGARWRMRTRVTTTTTMLLPLHNNVIVASPLSCSQACKNRRARALAGFGE